VKFNRRRSGKRSGTLIKPKSKLRLRLSFIFFLSSIGHNLTFVVFMALPNCFELFGFDFLVDSSLNCFILEANAGPDLKNTGSRLDYVIISLIEGIMANAVDSFFPLKAEDSAQVKKGNLQLVLDHKGKSWGKSQIKLTD
jgi:uncharacterized membrane protein